MFIHLATKSKSEKCYLDSEERKEDCPTQQLDKWIEKVNTKIKEVRKNYNADNNIIMETQIHKWATALID